MTLHFEKKGKKKMTFTPKKVMDKAMMIIRERAKAKNPKITA